MPIRRPHPKSRHGCSSCKRRRVKCDETRPVCKNCRRREDEDTCVYTTLGPFVFAKDTRGSPRRALQKSKSPRSDSGSASDRPSHSLHNPFTSSGATADAPAINVQHLELELQWIRHTHKLFARNEETRKVWELSVLQEAFQAPFLMHGIIALTALHLSHEHRDNQQAEWLSMAVAHKSTALSMFSTQLNDITESNAKAMMSFAGIAVAFSFASALACPDPDDGPSLPALIDVFVLARGVQAVVNQATDFLHHSNFAPLFNIVSPEVIIPEATLEAFDRLDNLNDQCYEYSAEHNVQSYKKVIASLRDLVCFTYAEPRSLTLAAGWAIRSSQHYLKELNNRAPFALVVLAHYCVFLHQARDNWCMGSWGQAVIEEIKLLLDPSWKSHLGWPISEISIP
ncbi:unnamed protein product [Penicillium nalgiovense]|nr:unnamed protein product [Penicillium nalgiovense]